MNQPDRHLSRWARRRMLWAAAILMAPPWAAALPPAATIASSTAAGPAAARTAAAQIARLHHFHGNDGQRPNATLLLASDGNWYGTTDKGGTFGNGVIFRLAADGAFTALHAFEERLRGRSDQPYTTLAKGPDGALYGSKSVGGNGNGSLYKISLDGVYTDLHRFRQGDPFDGSIPLGPPVAAADGFLYGSTRDGGAHGLGTVYRLSVAGELTIIHAFGGTNQDGRGPTSLIVGTDGALYGSSTYGPGRDLGAVFRMTLDGQWSLVHAFPENRKDGVFPGQLVSASDGSLVGVAVGLVSGPKGDFQGLIFRIDPSGQFSILHGFRNGGRGGEQPNTALAIGAGDTIYGCTFSGGAYDRGVAFKIKPNGTFGLLYAFGGPDHPEFQRPTTGLAIAADDGLYGVMSGVHVKGNRHGSVIRLTQNAAAHSTVHRLPDHPPAGE